MHLTFRSVDAIEHRIDPVPLLPATKGVRFGGREYYFPMATFDAIIIGTGQAASGLAGRLTAAGMKTAVVERRYFGGTCVNTGCIPTKTLVASAEVARKTLRAAEFGVDIAPGVKAST